MATDFTGLSWYPWFPDLWMGSASVRRMSLEEREVYRELLDWQWQEKGYLPLDLAELSALLGFDLAKYPKALAMFPSCGTWKPGKRANAVLLRIWTRKNAKENGIPGKGWTLQDCMLAAQPIAMPKEMVEDFFCNYAAVGWIDAAGRRVIDLSAALSKWKANQASRGKAAERPNRPHTVHELQTIRDQLTTDLLVATDKGRPTGEIRERLTKIKQQISNYGK